MASIQQNSTPLNSGCCDSVIVNMHKKDEKHLDMTHDNHSEITQVPNRVGSSMSPSPECIVFFLTNPLICNHVCKWDLCHKQLCNKFSHSNLLSAHDSGSDQFSRGALLRAIISKQTNSMKTHSKIGHLKQTEKDFKVNDCTSCLLRNAFGFSFCPSKKVKSHVTCPSLSIIHVAKVHVHSLVLETFPTYASVPPWIHT